MAWEISHTAQAWANVRARLTRTWKRKELIDALCDDLFESVEADSGDEGCRTASDAALILRRELSGAPHDALVQSVMDAIERHNTCDNGGHRFWIDRKGYHTVSCSTPETGTCGACEAQVDLVREENGIVHLSCGCTTIPEEWASEE